MPGAVSNVLRMINPRYFVLSQGKNINDQDLVVLKYA